MKYKFEHHPICPHCDHEVKDHWEYSGLLEDQDGYEIECPSCEEKYLVDSVITYAFSSRKVPCSKEKGHEWGAGYALRVEARLCDKWNEEGFLKRHDWAPHSTWRRSCLRCKREEYFHSPEGAELPYDATDPWEAAK